MHTHLKRLILGILALCFPLIAVSTRAQEDDCPALILKALETTSNECLDIGRGEVCYGHVKLKADPREDVPSDQFVFEKPGDRLKVDQLKSLKMGALDLQNNEWGVAYMRIRANLPDVAAGQFVTVIMFGDTEVRDASVELNTQNDTQYSPMQAFYFRTGIGGETNTPLCSQFPTSGVLIQTPKGGERVELMVNEVRLSVGSTIFLEAPGEPETLGNLQTPTGVDALKDRTQAEMKISIFEGSVQAEIAGNVTTATTGEALSVPLDEDSRPAGQPEKSETSTEQDALINLVIEAAADELITFEGETPTPSPTPQEIGFAVVETATPIPSATLIPSPLPPPPTLIPTSVNILGGNAQSAVVNTGFGQAMQVQMVNAGGFPVTGVQVKFLAPASGATAYFYNPGDQITEATVTTDTNGIATSPAFTASTTAGSFSVVAYELITGAAATLNLSIQPGAPAMLSLVNGDGQSAAVNTPFGTNFAVRITDAYNNPLSGLGITFTAPSGGASGTFAGSGTNVINGLSDGSGLATATTFSANTIAGSYTVSATYGALPPVNFGVTNSAGAPATVNLLSGSGQTATVTTAYGGPLQVRVEDAYGNPVLGASVSFTAPGGGASGTFAATGTNAEAVTTDGAGIATSSVFTANTMAGAVMVNATSGGASPAVFNLTNTAGAPATVSAIGGTPQSAPVASAFGAQLQALVTDAYSNPVGGANVTFTAPAAGASGTFAGTATYFIVALTNSGGIASSTVFTANTMVGGYTVSASIGGPATSYSLTNLPGTPASLSILGGDGQSAQVNTAFGTALQVQVYDAYSNVVPGTNVSFSAPGGGASLIFGGTGTNTITTVADGVGIANAGGMSANGVMGSYLVTASSGTGSTVFNLTNTPPPNTVYNLNDSGAGSLRDVIAVASPGATITFVVSGTITLTSGEIVINKDLTLNGPGNVAVSGNNASRIFNITAGTVNISRLTITNGSTPIGGGGIMITSPATLNLADSTISYNTAAGGSGLYSNSSPGGGVINVSRSAFIGNVATTDAGGAIQTNGPATVVNSTFSGNSAGGGGGAVSARTYHMDIFNSTFVNNTSGSPGAVEAQIGQGGSITLYNSIVANNAGAGNCSTLSDGGGNLVFGDASCPGVNANPNLGGLTGSPAYLPLIAPSPAENLGGANCPATDQRGVGRGTPCDAGAYELP